MERSRERRIKGLGVSPGIVIGRVFRLESGGLSYSARRIPHTLIPLEIQRFHNALKRSREEIAEVKERILARGLHQQAYILEVHQQLLEDRMLIEETEKLIKEKLINAEWALEIVLKKITEVFEGINEEYIRERKGDIKQVIQRLIKNLAGERGYELEEVEAEEVVVVAHDLSPAETIQLNLREVAGFATDVGGWTSHTAIVARSLAIPAVVALGEITASTQGGERIILDGTEGLVVIEPTEATVREYELKKQRYKYVERELLKYAPLPAETLDGYHLALRANIELPEELPLLSQYGAEGVGLYRTEYLYLNRRDLPTEEEHLQVYRKIAEESLPHWATIRTFDLGGDKLPIQLGAIDELNPAMGLRAIRLCLKEPEIFRTQLRGIMKASAYGKVRILLPMISSLEELRVTKRVIDEIKEELERERVPFDPDLPIGVMIEVPSAAVIADLLASEVDFFSIGTNDLIQYSLAADRSNEGVSYLFQPFHPAILRLIRHVVEMGHKRGIEVGICGEVAADPLFTPIFLGLGLDELSMNALSIPRVKKVLRRFSQEEGREILREVLQFSTAKEVEGFIRNEMVRRFPDEFIRCVEAEA